MARRTLQASPEGITTINKTLKRKKRSQTYLAGVAGCSRQTIWSLLHGNAIDCDVFMAVCTELGLDWQTIAVSDDVENDNPVEIDALVTEIRDAVRSNIKEECGTMRVLDMTQPIGLGKIYTQVNILEKITGRRRLSLEQFVERCGVEEFDRFGLTETTEERVPGLEAVGRYSKLMVLGQPGAGKTSFLKYLAMQCRNGSFLGDCVPIFVPLKQFAEMPDQPGLLKFVAQKWETCGVTEAQTQALPVLNAGRALVLLDGLDEVAEDDGDRILQEIQTFSQQFHTCHFVVTCRIAAREYTFTQFTEVEVAPFDDDQIRQFATQWFESKNLDFTEDFIEQLKENPRIRELATNPLLLTLLCLEFEESGDFPADRAELYQRAVTTLLRKWDSKRRIQRQQVYRQLSVPRKEDMLSQIAWRTFEQGEYFFKQRQVERHIADYIGNLPDAPTDAQALHVDSEAVLKSIEAQHGLLVERARGIYSFSHLTFQEFFTARAVERRSIEIGELVQHVTETRWREVFLLAAQLLSRSDADELVQGMKREVDGWVARDEKIQAYLQWLQRKANSVGAPYKPAAIRAFYLYISLALYRDLSRTLAYDLDLFLHIDLSPAVPFDLYHALAFDLHHTLAFDISRSLDHSLYLDLALYLDLDLALYLDLDLNIFLDLEISRALYLSLYLDLDISRVLKKSSQCAPELVKPILALQAKLPNPERGGQEKKQWCEANGQAWREELSAVAIQYRDIGHDWQFTDKQKELLQQYYDANLLLVDCLKQSDTSRAVREEIEATLLLPRSARGEL